MLHSIKQFLKNNPITRPIFSFCSNLYYGIDQKRVESQKRHDLQQEGVPIIEKVQQILADTDYRFFFDMGTLLGIVREGRLLKHDMDIDLAVVVNGEEDKLRLKEILSQHGMCEKYRYTVESIGIVEQSFSYRNVKFDINYYYQNGDTDECYLLYRDPEQDYSDGHLDVVKLCCPHIEETCPIAFQGIMINAPQDPERYLATRYGENWRIPDKKYVYWKGPSTVPTDLVGYQAVSE